MIFVIEVVGRLNFGFSIWMILVRDGSSRPEWQNAVYSEICKMSSESQGEN